MAVAHIDYTGIIGFIRRPNSSRPAKYLVLAPEARSHSHAHSCWLQVLKASEVVKPRGKAHTCPTGQEVFLLDHVMSWTGHKMSSLDLTGFKTQFMVPLAESDPDPKAGKLHKKYLKSLNPQLKKHPKVALWAEIDTGVLSTLQIEHCDGWKFGSLESNPSFRVAQVVRHTLELEGSVLKLNFSGKGSSQDYTLEITAMDNDIHLEIGNTPNPCGVTWPMKKEDHHVKLYNQLAAVTKGHDELNPLVHVDLCSDDPDEVLRPREVGGANCPPGLWTESDDA